MSPRDAFLSRVRQAVRQGNQAGAPPLPERGAVGYQGAGDDPVSHFGQQLLLAGGFFHPAPDADTAVTRLLDILQTRSVKRVLLAGNQFLDSLPLSRALAGAGLEVLPAESASREETFSADAGVTGVDYLIAETGSLAFLSRPAQPRSASLLPPLHVTLAHAGQLVPDLFDLFTPKLWPDGPLACLSLVTGPSKTGDIELRLVTGVHGPGEVHVVLVARAL